jgi:hypothetical protein
MDRTDRFPANLLAFRVRWVSENSQLDPQVTRYRIEFENRGITVDQDPMLCSKMTSIHEHLTKV